MAGTTWRNLAAKNPPAAAWLLSAAVIGVAVVAWGQTWRWHLAGLTTYQIFPVIGLVAFSTMWAQYAVAELGKYLAMSGDRLAGYFRATGFIVLAAIALHPGLLIWQLWRDGFGLPPGSYLDHFVAPGLRWVALIGTVCFFIFLAYELRYKFGRRPWWRYMDYLIDAAMLAIFYHGLRLGTQTSGGWFHAVWIFYGVTLLSLLAHKYYKLARRKEAESRLGSSEI